MRSEECDPNGQAEDAWHCMRDPRTALHIRLCADHMSGASSTSVAMQATATIVSICTSGTSAVSRQERPFAGRGIEEGEWGTAVSS